MAKGRKNVSMLDFIQIHETSESFDEVVERTGLKPLSVQARVSTYRSPALDEDGNIIRPAIPLKQFPRAGGSRMQVDSVMELLAKIRGVSVSEIAAESDVLAVKTAERAAKRAAKKAAQ